MNADDPQAELLGAVNLDAARVAFGIHASAEVRAKIERHRRDGSRFFLSGFAQEVMVNLRLPGESAISHALAAAAVAWARGVDASSVVAGLESVTSLPGRLDRIEEGQCFDVRVDEARHPAALRESLATLRTFATGRVHCVIGAEGRPGDSTANVSRRALAGHGAKATSRA